MYLRTIAVLASFLALTGCASSLNAVFRRAIVENRIEPGTRVLSMDASRRSIVMQADERGVLQKICAEPPPDVADKLTAALEASGKISSESGESKKSTEAALKDSFALDAVKLFDRPAAVDIFRTGSYALCQMHLNGAIHEPDLGRQYADLLEKTFKSLESDAEARKAEAVAAKARADADKAESERKAAEAEAKPKPSASLASSAL
jgi:hypothetical protein